LLSKCTTVELKAMGAHADWATRAPWV
jgi:hypothetical protein